MKELSDHREPQLLLTLFFCVIRRSGRGWVFGLNEGLDQAGATVGPLIVALLLYLKSGFRTGFGVLLVSSVLTN